MENQTKKELDEFRATARTCIQNEIENCTKFDKNITSLKEDWLRIEEKSEALSFIKYRKCICIAQSLKVDAALKEMTKKNEWTLSFHPYNTIKKILSTFPALGQILNTTKQSQPAKITTQKTDTTQNKPEASRQSDPENKTSPGLELNKSYQESISSRKYSPGIRTSKLTKSDQVCAPASISSHQPVQDYRQSEISESEAILKVKSSKKCNVTISGDSSICYVTGICETSAGEFIITDGSNNTVKLLDQTFKVVAQSKLPGKPRSMCSISSSLVAVTNNDSEVHFISVNKGQLVQDRTLKLQHECQGIAHQHGNLYITDGRALFRYTVNGRLICKMYEEASSLLTVTFCAVSPDGDRIYIFNEKRAKLVTLSADGKVISYLTDRGQIATYFPYVTELGQVLVCSQHTSKILQVDRDGRQILSEVATQKNGVTNPTSVYYSKHTDSLIVGLNGEIIVFKVEFLF